MRPKLFLNLKYIYIYTQILTVVSYLLFMYVLTSIHCKLMECVAVQNDNSVCSFPEWMNKHHREWRSVANSLPGLLQTPSSRVDMPTLSMKSMHINKRGHSLKFHNSKSSSQETQATCHKLEIKNKKMSKIVAHVKSGW